MQCVFLSMLRLSWQALTQLGCIRTVGSDSCCWFLWHGIETPFLFFFCTHLLLPPALSPLLHFVMFCSRLSAVNYNHGGTHKPQCHGRKDHLIACLMFVSSGGKKQNSVFTVELHLVTELKWRWVLVSGLGQKNAHGPGDSWDITPTPLGWFVLLCMSQTNHYICFYFVFCLCIEKREKLWF